jgi:hypothetical protein
MVAKTLSIVTRTTANENSTRKPGERSFDAVAAFGLGRLSLFNGTVIARKITVSGGPRLRGCYSIVAASVQRIRFAKRVFAEVTRCVGYISDSVIYHHGLSRRITPSVQSALRSVCIRNWKLCSTVRTKHEGQCHLHSCDIPAHFECLAANWQYDSLSIEIPICKGKYRSPSTVICSSGNPNHG